MANFQFLDYDSAHKFVEDPKQRRGRDIWWDNYDIMIWKKNPAGFSSPEGLFRNGQWGIAKRIKVRSSGHWRLLVVNDSR